MIQLAIDDHSFVRDPGILGLMYILGTDILLFRNVRNEVHGVHR